MAPIMQPGHLNIGQKHQAQAPMQQRNPQPSFFSNASSIPAMQQEEENTLLSMQDQQQ
jgi:hypothetical protein